MATCGVCVLASASGWGARASQGHPLTWREQVGKSPRHRVQPCRVCARSPDVIWGGREPQIIYYVLVAIRPGRGCSRGSRCRAGRSFARWPGRPASGRCWCPHQALGSGRGVSGGAMLTWSKCRSGTRRVAPPRSRRARRGSAARRWWHPHSSTTSQRPDDGVRVVVVPGSEVAVERVSRGHKQPPRARQGHLGLELDRLSGALPSAAGPQVALLISRLLTADLAADPPGTPALGSL